MYLLILVTLTSLACSGLLYFRYIARRGDDFLLQLGQFVSVMVMMFFGTAIVAGDVNAFPVYRIIVSVGAAIASAIGMRKSRTMAALAKSSDEDEDDHSD